jgi:hypothetical protein
MTRQEHDALLVIKVGHYLTRVALSIYGLDQGWTRMSREVARQAGCKKIDVRACDIGREGWPVSDKDDLVENKMDFCRIIWRCL